MNKLMQKLGIDKSQVVTNNVTRAKGKETTDSEETGQVRLQMNNVFLGSSKLVNNATCFEPIYKRNESGKILLDKDGSKAIEGYKTKHLTGNYIIEDNGDGTSIATKFNVYKDTYQIDNDSLSITKVTNGNGTK